MNEYQTAAIRTAARYEDTNIRLSVRALGLAGEAGEFADMIKKVVGHGHEIDYDKMAAELGDVLWYVANLADSLNFDLNDIAQMNVDKLKKRYPDGFTTERSINRIE